MDEIEERREPPGRISPRRAFTEIGAVYFIAFGLGVVSAIGLLTDPSLSADQQIRTWLEAASEMMQYIMQASAVILGVGYFSLRRGLTLRTIFGRFTKPAPRVMYYPQTPYQVPAYPVQTQSQSQTQGQSQIQSQSQSQMQVAQSQLPPEQGPYPYPTPYPYPYPYPYPAPAPAYPPQMGYYPTRPAERGLGWQFSRAFFLSTAGTLAFLVTVVVYIRVSGDSTGAPNQGHSLWLIPVGLVVALAAGFGEEVLITGMVVTTLEQAGFGKRAWVIYLAAIALRIPFHLYYGWASLAVVFFTVGNVWVYRRWRVLWPIVLAHALYDAIQFAGALQPALAGLALLGLGLATFVMVIVIACIELSDWSARRRFNRWQAAVGV